MLEVEVPKGLAGQSREVASVDVKYLDLKSQRSDALQGLASVRYSAAPEEVKRAVNKPVMEKAIEQQSNEMSKDVLKRLDEGRVKEAQKLQEQNVRMLKKNAQMLDSPALGALSSEAEEDFDSIKKGRISKQSPKRKELKERQFKRETQQQY